MKNTNAGKFPNFVFTLALSIGASVSALAAEDHSAHLQTPPTTEQNGNGNMGSMHSAMMHGQMGGMMSGMMAQMQGQMAGMHGKMHPQNGGAAGGCPMHKMSGKN